VNGPDGPSLDWDSIFQRARHHMVRRVLLVGAIAAFGALLLFSGGTASWKVIADKNKAKPPATSTHHHHKPGGGHHKGGTGGSGHGHHQPKPPHPPKPQPHPDPGPGPCAGKAAAAKEYCEREAIRRMESDSGKATESELAGQ
jgi:hypothetical protein